MFVVGINIDTPLMCRTERGIEKNKQVITTSFKERKLVHYSFSFALCVHFVRKASDIFR